mgnify:CR=1 FL=1
MSNKKGFSVVALLLTMLVITAVSFTGYYVWLNQDNKQEKKSSLTDPNASNKQVGLEELNSKVCNSRDTFCLNYPESWKSTIEARDQNTPATQGDETITIVSPGGSKLTLHTNVSGFGGVCNEGDVSTNITNVKSFKGNSSRSIVTTKSQDDKTKVFLSTNEDSVPKVGISTSCTYAYLGLVTNSALNKSFLLVGEVSNPSDYDKMVKIIDSLNTEY